LTKKTQKRQNTDQKQKNLLTLETTATPVGNRNVA